MADARRAKKAVKKGAKRSAKAATKTTTKGAKAAKRSAKKVAKAATTKSAKRATTKRTAKKAARAGASGGTRADKGEGAPALRAVLQRMRPEHRAIGERIDAIVAREAPDARRAVKWGTPMWGMEGRGWFAAFGSFKDYAKVNFFSGASLDPVPPEGEGKAMRSVNIASLAELDEAQLASWVRQAAAIPGWGK